jgi:hypothetical protein
VRCIRGRWRTNSQLDSSFWQALSTNCRSYLNEMELDLMATLSILTVPFVSHDASRSTGTRRTHAVSSPPATWLYIYERAFLIQLQKKIRNTPPNRNNFVASCVMRRDVRARCGWWRVSRDDSCVVCEGGSEQIVSWTLHIGRHYQLSAGATLMKRSWI